VYIPQISLHIAGNLSFNFLICKVLLKIHALASLSTEELQKIL